MNYYYYYLLKYYYYYYYCVCTRQSYENTHKLEMTKMTLQVRINVEHGQGSPHSTLILTCSKSKSLFLALRTQTMAHFDELGILTKAFSGFLVHHFNGRIFPFFLIIGFLQRTISYVVNFFFCVCVFVFQSGVVEFC